MLLNLLIQRFLVAEKALTSNFQKGLEKEAGEFIVLKGGDNSLSKYNLPSTPRTLNPLETMVLQSPREEQLSGAFVDNLKSLLV